MLRRSVPILLLALLAVSPLFAGERENALRDAASAGDLETVKTLERLHV